MNSLPLPPHQHWLLACIEHSPIDSASAAESIIELPALCEAAAPVDPSFSLFATCQSKVPCDTISLPAFLDGIKNGCWRAEVRKCRDILKTGGKGAYDDLRSTTVPAFTLSAVLNHRRSKTTLEQKGARHSGLLQLDFDAKDHLGMTLEEICDIVWAASFTVACFVSLSGDGIKAIARCPASFDTHAGSWLAAEAYFAERGLKLDPNTKDPCRLCFVSFDPSALSRNEAEEIVPLPVPERSAEGNGSNGEEDPAHVRRKLLELAEKIGPQQNRNTWLHIVASTVDAVGEDAAGEIVDEYFPPFEPWPQSACDVVKGWTGTWLSLRKYGIDPEDHTKWLDVLPDLTEGEKSEPTRKKLSDFLVSHADTLGMTWQQIDALRPAYIIDNILRQGEVALLGAESKSRKSWLAQDAGFAVAAGLPWLADVNGANGFATAQARVHVFDLELNPSEMRYRFAKARGNRFAESPEDAAAMTARVVPYSLDGLNVSQILPMLEQLKATVEPGDLVIVDCLYRLCPDGNEVAPLAEILETVKRFAAETKTGVILIDHFRKAGDDKARNRFAGSFVKQASAGTLVAIEVTADDVLVLNIDARTFYGCPRVHVRFNSETYAFNRLPEIEVEKAKQERTQAESEGWLLTLWKGRTLDATATAADAVKRWGIKRQGVEPRLGKLVSRGWLHRESGGAGKATKWTLVCDDN